MQHYKILSKYNSGDQILGNTGRIYGTCGGQVFGAGDLQEKNHS